MWSQLIVRTIATGNLQFSLEQVVPACMKASSQRPVKEEDEFSLDKLRPLVFCSIRLCLITHSLDLLCGKKKKQKNKKPFNIQSGEQISYLLFFLQGNEFQSVWKSSDQKIDYTLIQHHECGGRINSWYFTGLRIFQNGGAGVSFTWFFF